MATQAIKFDPLLNTGIQIKTDLMDGSTSKLLLPFETDSAGIFFFITLIHWFLFWTPK